MDTVPETLGKDAGTESFPVATLFLRRAARGRVAAFYHLARAADDAADDPRLGAAARHARLDAVAMAARDRGDPLVRDHLEALLPAFRRDADETTVADWADLMAYCHHSAVPVGRFLLALHGVAGVAARAASDSLCMALQVLNHVQDCGRDARTLGRVYLPADWLAAEGLDRGALMADSAPAGLHRVLDRTLDGADGLLAAAAPLPGLVAAGGLRRQAAMTLGAGRRLSARLRRSDPLARRISLTALDKAALLATGLRP